MMLFNLSNELDKRKDRKDIWPFLKTAYAGKKMVHVGDNENSDFLFPREFGIDTIKIESGKSLFSQLNYWLLIRKNFYKIIILVIRIY